MSVGRFQCGVAAIIYHAETRTYLLLRRATHRDFGGGDWEGVTGRVNQGENFEAALHREVAEELGVRVQIEFIIGTSHFYRGDERPENELLAVKYACLIEERDQIVMSAEHSEHRWLTAEQVYALLPPSHWLHQTIRRAEYTRPLLPAELIDLHSREGFEGG